MPIHYNDAGNRTCNQTRTAGTLILVALFSAAMVACGDDVTPFLDAGPLDSGPRDGGSDSVTADSGPDARVDVPPVVACNMDATLGNFCRSNLDCSDRCFCNGREVCQGGTCVRGRGACDDEIECTADSCSEETGSCTNTPANTVCDDGNSCTGEEVCDSDLGCLAGLPMNCSDGNSCTLDSCSPEEGCRNILRDLDGDGFADARCEGGTDCNDDPLTGAMVNPGAMEVCDNGVDDNCDGVADVFDTMTCRPLNDVCADARVLDSPGGYDFTTVGLADDYELDCESGTDHPDAVFTFTITAIRDVVISIPTSTLNTSLELRALADCEMAETAPIFCDRDTSNFSDEAIIEADRLAPGTYAIIVSTATGEFGRLQLAITSPVPPPREDLCNAMTPLLSGSASFGGDFDLYGNDYPNLSCRASFYTDPREEVAYRISIARPTNVTITADGLSSSGFQRDVSLALVRDCSNPVGSEIACEISTFSREAEIVATPLPAGNYFVLVEPAESSTVAYQLNAELTVPPPPVPGDSCTLPLDITGMSASVALAAISNNGGLGCGGSSLAYRDATFMFTVTATSDVLVTTNAPTFHLFAVATDCSDTSTEVVCQPSTSAGAGSATLNGLAPGTYFVNVAVPSDMGSVMASATVTPL